jgi:hypothetical protein
MSTDESSKRWFQFPFVPKLWTCIVHVLPTASSVLSCSAPTVPRAHSSTRVCGGWRQDGYPSVGCGGSPDPHTPEQFRARAPFSPTTIKYPGLLAQDAEADTHMMSGLIPYIQPCHPSGLSVLNLSMPPLFFSIRPTSDVIKTELEYNSSSSLHLYLTNFPSH